MRDISERIAAEEARAQNAERMREIDRLKEIDRFKTQFINNAAHELGTPLTPIKMQLHLLQRGRGSSLDPRQQKAVEVLKRNVDRLSTLVQDVLDVSRAQADRLGLQKKEIDINRAVVEAVESFEESARHAGITLRSSLTPNLVLPADEKRLTQVLFNLLTNAIKFSPKGRAILVKTARDGDAAVIQVVDEGIGIAPEDQARLFQPFSQLEDPMQRTRSGSGLGLYISKSIVELHGGKLTLQSEGRDKGKTFTIQLPLAGSAPARTEPETGAPHAAPRQEPAPASPRESLQKRIDELV